MRALLVAVITLAGVCTQEAAAHVEVAPGVLESGREVVLEIELPLLRPGPPPTSLAVSGRGVRQLAADAAGRVGRETRWRVRVRVDAEPGPLQLLLRASFADGRSVDVRQSLTVVPARDPNGSPLPEVAAAATAAVGAALVALALVARRRARRSR
ncbi:MAG TPA: hypothetical protein VEY87_00260 [Gaiellaceae bacterium]|nr:hypothetical protein [Gaiellaceae bacterium]